MLLGGVLETSWDLFGPLWDLWWPLGVILAPKALTCAGVFNVLKDFGVFLGPSWVLLGPWQASLGPSGTLSWALLKTPLGDHGPIFTASKTKRKRKNERARITEKE